MSVPPAPAAPLRPAVACRAGVLAALLALAALAPPATSRPGPYEHVLDPADSLARAGRPDRAAAWADSLVALARARHDGALEAAVASRRVLGWVASGRFDEGVAEARRVGSLARAAGDSLSWGRALLAEGRAQLFRERLAEAEGPYRRLLAVAHATGDAMLEGNADLGLAYLDLRANRVRGAERRYRRAIALLERSRDTFSEMSARVGLARVLRQQGRRDEARRSYRSILERCRVTGDRLNEADAWNNLGTMEADEGEPGTAAADFARALDVARTIRGANPSIAGNLAVMLVEAGRTDAAADTLEGELARVPRGAPRVSYRLRTQLAVVRNLQGRPADAERLLRELWAARDSVPPDLAAEAGRRLVDVVDRRSGPSDAFAVALELDRAYARRLPADDEADRQLQLADLERRIGRPDRALARLRRVRQSPPAARSWKLPVRLDELLSLAFEDAGSPDSAVAAILRAGDRWERTAEAVRNAEWYEPIGNSAGQLSVQTAHALLDPRRPGPPQRRAREAFDAVQRFKSRALDWRTRPGTPRRPEALTTAASMQQRVLRAGEVFVDAYSTRGRPPIVFVLDRDEVRAYEARAFEDPMSGLRRPLALLGSDDPRTARARAAAAARLSENLFGPASHLVLRSRRVIVSLSGFLNAIPVAALPAGSPSGEPLAAGHTLVSVPSASWLARHRRGPSPAIDPATVVTLARTTDDRGRALDGVREEARWLTGRYGGAGVVNAGDRTLADLLPWFSRGDILHVASHARASSHDAWGSAFLLGRGDDADAWLSARRIAALPVRAKLAVLASCRTTLDRGFNNESVLGLARAFHAAGVPTALSTLWSVDDAATAAFTRRFYLALEQGRTAAGALQQAQVETMRPPGTSAPIYWAGFVLSGDPDTRVRPRRAH